MLPGESWLVKQNSWVTAVARLMVLTQGMRKAPFSVVMFELSEFATNHNGLVLNFIPWKARLFSLLAV